MADAERIYRIGQIAAMLDVRTSVLRYWEQEFPMLSPTRLPSGHRGYGVKDLHLLQRIKDLLYKKGMTIEGARQQMRKYALTVMSEEELDARLARIEDMRRAKSERRRQKLDALKAAGIDPKAGRVPTAIVHEASPEDTNFLRSVLEDLRALRAELAGQAAEDMSA